MDHISHTVLVCDVHTGNNDWLMTCHISPEKLDNCLSQQAAARSRSFARTDILRKSCVIKVTLCTPISTLLLESHCLRAISRMHGLNNVTLVIDFENRIWQAHDPSSDAQVLLLLDFAPLLARVSSVVDSTLEASSSREITMIDYWTVSCLEMIRRECSSL